MKSGKSVDFSTRVEFSNNTFQNTCFENEPTKPHDARLLETTRKKTISADSSLTFNCCDSVSEASLPIEHVSELTGSPPIQESGSSSTLDSDNRVTGDPLEGVLRVLTLEESLDTDGITRSPIITKEDGLDDRAIKWDSLRLYRLNTILADNPAVSSGPPIGIGWDLIGVDKLSIDEFEENRAPRRRHHEQLIVPRLARELRLQQAGYERRELNEMSSELEKLKKQRMSNAMPRFTERIKMMGRSRHFKWAKAS